MAFNCLPHGFRYASFYTDVDVNSETLSEESELVAEEVSSTVLETSSVDASDANMLKESDEKTREEKYKAALKSKENQLQECQKRELEKKYKAALRSKENQLQECQKRLNTTKAENQGIKSAYTEKQKQLDDCRKRLSEEQQKSANLSQQVKYFTSRLSQEEAKSKKIEDDLHHSITSYSWLRDSYNKDMKRHENEICYTETRLSKKDNEVRVLQEELKEKTARLASMFEKQLKHDQRSVENTVEFNTPTELEKDFNDLFDGERIDACERMESVLKRDDDTDVEIYYPRLACIIFVTAYEVSKEARDAACDLFSNVTKQLIEGTPRMSQELCFTRKETGLSSHFPITIDVSVGMKDTEMSRDVLDGLMLCLKQTAHSCNLDFFENVVEEAVRERWRQHLQEDETQLLPAFSEEVLAQLSDYIKACIRLTWRMVTQVPPLQLEYKAVKFDKNIHKLTRAQCSAERSGYGDQFGEFLSQNIACYLWPALLETGGRVIFPGEVLCKVELDYEII